MVLMPETYDDQLRRKEHYPGLAETMFLLPYDIKDAEIYRWYDSVYYNYDGKKHGIFHLLYCLRSYPLPTDDRKFILYFITTDGIFVETTTRGIYDVPINFRSVYAKLFCSFDRGTFVTLRPHTRQIVVLQDIRYTEFYDGKMRPNTFVSPSDENEDTGEHYFMIESKELPPLKVPFTKQLYDALKNHVPYIWVRSDNYVALSDLRFWHQSF